MTRQREDDACPGALRPHAAADGELLRLRVPGGALAVSTLRGLRAASLGLADGRLGLTSRGNVQLRGVRSEDVPALVEQVRELGMLPDAAHERVRNIVATPLSGRGPGSLDDIDPLVDDLDAALCARPGLAGLPGRFLFAVDDGSGDVQGEGADVLAVALGDGRYAVRPAGVARGLRVGVENVVAAMLAVAEDFLAERAAQDSRAWRIAELAGGGAPVLERLRASGWTSEDQQTDGGAASVTPVAPRATDPGLIEQRDGRFAVCALTPLGLLTAEQALALAAAAELSASDRPRGALRVTPWRRVVVRDLELPAALAVRELLSSVGLVIEPGTAWSRLTACAGRPGCAKSLTDVHEDVRAFAAIAETTGPALHWAGCERSCGTPSGADVVRVLATTAGYRLEGEAELAARDLVGIGMPVQREPGAAAGSALPTGIGGTA